MAATAAEDCEWRSPMVPAGVSMLATTPSALPASFPAPGAALAVSWPAVPGTRARSMSCQPEASLNRTGVAETMAVLDPSRLATTFLVGVVSASMVTERSGS